MPSEKNGNIENTFRKPRPVHAGVGDKLGLGVWTNQAAFEQMNFLKIYFHDQCFTVPFTCICNSFL